MYLVEQSGLSAAALPISDLRTHLRLASGFADDAQQDPLLERALRAALAQIEAATGKAILTRDFSFTVGAWREIGRQVLPRAPLAEVTGLVMIEADGTRTALAVDTVHIRDDAHRPALVAKGFALPAVPAGGRIEVSFRAGIAAEWAGRMRTQCAMRASRTCCPSAACTSVR